MNDEAFGRAITSAFLGVEQHPDLVVLLSAKAQYAEVEYGWIDLDSAISNAPAPLLRVNRFLEKPSLRQARILRLGTEGFGEVLCAAPQELPRLDVHGATRRESNQM